MRDVERQLLLRPLLQKQPLVLMPAVTTRMRKSWSVRAHGMNSKTTTLAAGATASCGHVLKWQSVGAFSGVPLCAHSVLT